MATSETSISGSGKEESTEQPKLEETESVLGDTMISPNYKLKWLFMISKLAYQVALPYFCPQ